MRVVSMEPRHRAAVASIVKSVGVFNDEEMKVALDLVDSYLNGEEEYIVRVAVDDDGSVAGYVCYGRAPLTEGVYHLYWIAVHPSRQRNGAGRNLMETMEEEVGLMGGRMILAETSSTERYQAARRFYSLNGYRQIARVEDFYRADDSLLIYRKDLFPPR